MYSNTIDTFLATPNLCALVLLNLNKSFHETDLRFMEAEETVRPFRLSRPATLVQLTSPAAQSSYPVQLISPAAQPSYPVLLSSPATQSSYPVQYPLLLPSPATRSSYPDQLPRPATRSSCPVQLPSPATQSSYLVKLPILDREGIAILDPSLVSSFLVVF
jgi:hypothetical protein